MHCDRQRLHMTRALKLRFGTVVARGGALSADLVLVARRAKGSSRCLCRGLHREGVLGGVGGKSSNALGVASAPLNQSRYFKSEGVGECVDFFSRRASYA
jgi:hypothetical protein